MNTEQTTTIKISDDIIANCVADTVLGIPGVCQLTGGLTDSISKNLLGKGTGTRGVRVSHGENGITLDIYVIVEYRVKIPQLAWEIQSSVKKRIETLAELSVIEVNIHVQGVNLAREEDVE